MNVRRNISGNMLMTNLNVRLLRSLENYLRRIMAAPGKSGLYANFYKRKDWGTESR